MASDTACRPRLADILRQHAPAALSADAARVVRDLVACRTPSLGGHQEACDHCGELRDSYNSCGNRHCPVCQGLEEARWLERQQADLLPVPYFHVVFTLPAVLHPLFLGAPRLAYALLFAAAAETLVEVARRNLQATPGLLIILHTWTQTLAFHPHLHCLVTGGGLRLDRAAWVATRQTFLLPVRKLRRVFAAKLREKFSAAAEKGQLRQSLRQTRALLWQSKKTQWRMYAKAPFAGPQQVLRYLGRYTHRTAISNERLVSFRDGKVTFSYRDRKHGNTRKQMTLEGPEFTRRFLQHVVPKGFVRVRHYGILANPYKRRLLAICRRRLGTPALATPAKAEPWYELIARLTGVDPRLCLRCGRGRYLLVRELPRDPLWLTMHTRSP